MSFNSVLEKYRKFSFSERDKGTKFEILMKHYLQTDPMYNEQFSNVWLWSEFPFRGQFGGIDTGIDLVAQDNNGKYTAVQCKCYQETARIDKPEVDTFLSTSGKHFKNDKGEDCSFSHRFWISTTNKWTGIAEDTLRNQVPAVYRIGLTQLENANVDWAELDNGAFGKKAQISQCEIN